MANTRSSKSKAASTKKPCKDTDTTTESNGAATLASKFALGPPDEIPSSVMILPKKASFESSMAVLPHPRSGQPSRFLICPKTGMYEFTTMEMPGPSSWLIMPGGKVGEDHGADGDEEMGGVETSNADEGEEKGWAQDYDQKDIQDDAQEESQGEAQDNIQKAVQGEAQEDTQEVQGEGEEGNDSEWEDVEEGKIISRGDLQVATPFDPLFLIIPSLVASSPILPSSCRDGAPRTHFLSVEDHVDAIPGNSTDTSLAEVLRMENGRFAAALERRISAVCDSVDAGDEKMYRLNEAKLLAELQAKAKRLAEDGLPEDMNEKFVKKVLEAPVLLVKKTTATTVTEDTSVTAATTTTTTSTTETTETTAMAIDSDTPTLAMVASPEIVALQAFRVAFDFICARYIPHSIHLVLRELVSDPSKSGIDFSPLADYVARLATARAEAHAARALGGDYTRKHGRDDDEAEAERAEKKRKAEEDKKKKASASRGVKDLKKVDTSGMKKLSAFFTKKPKE